MLAWGADQICRSLPTSKESCRCSYCWQQNRIADVEYSLTSLSGRNSLRMGKKCYTTAHEVGRQYHKESLHMWTDYERWCAEIKDNLCNWLQNNRCMYKETVRLILTDDYNMRTLSIKTVPRTLAKSYFRFICSFEYCKLIVKKSIVFKH